jgi:hypothetical protein
MYSIGSYLGGELERKRKSAWRGSRSATTFLKLGGEGKLKCGSAHLSHRPAYARGANVADAHLLVISATFHATSKILEKKCEGGGNAG